MPVRAAQLTTAPAALPTVALGARATQAPAARSTTDRAGLHILDLAAPNTQGPAGPPTMDREDRHTKDRAALATTVPAGRATRGLEVAESAAPRSASDGVLAVRYRRLTRPRQGCDKDNDPGNKFVRSASALFRSKPNNIRRVLAL